MSTVPITPSTSVVLINVDDYAPNDPVVLFGRDAAYGKLITVRDKTGTASANTPIYISTSAEAAFASDVSGDAFTIDQPFGSATLMYKGENPETLLGEWAIVNTFAYPSATTSATFQEVYVSSLTVDSGKFIYEHDGEQILNLYSTLFDLSADIRMNDFDISGAGYIYTQNIDTDYISSATAEINHLTVESTLAEYIDATVISTVDLYAEAFSTIDGEIKDLQASTIWASDLIETERISTVDLYADYSSTNTAEINELTVESTIAEYIDATVISTIDLYAESFSTIDGEIKDLLASTIWASDLIETDMISTVNLYADYSSTNTAEINELTVESTIAEYIDATVISTIDLFAEEFSTFIAEIKDLDASTIVAGFLDIDSISTTLLGADFISSFAISTFSLKANRVTVSSVLNVHSSIVTPNFYTSSILLQEANTATYVPIANQHRITVSSGFARLNNQDIYVIPRLISTHNLFLSSINLSTIVYRDNLGAITSTAVRNGEIYFNGSTIQIAAPFFSTVGYIASTINTSTISTGSLFGSMVSTASNFTRNLAVNTLTPLGGFVVDVSGSAFIRTLYISSLFASTQSVTGTNLGRLAINCNAPQDIPLFYHLDVNGNTHVASNFYTSSINTSSIHVSTHLYANTISTNSNLFVGGNSLLQGWTSTNTLYASNVSVASLLITPSISTNTISTASIFGSTATLTNALTTPFLSTTSISTASILGSTASLSNALTVPFISTTNISTNNVYANNISTNSISTNSVIGSTIVLINSLTAPWISTTNISTTNVNASNISTTSLSTNTLFARQISTNSIVSRDISATNLAFLNRAQASTLTVSSFSALSTVTNTLTAFTTMGTISTFTSTLHTSNILNVGAGLLRANRLIDAIEMGFTTTRVEISGNYIRHNAQSSNVLATPNISLFQNNTGANIEIYEGATTAATKNATLTVTRPTGTSTKFYSEHVQSNTNLRVGQGFLGGNGAVQNTFGIQYGENNGVVSTGIYLNSDGVGINTRNSNVAGSALTVNGQLFLSNTGLPIRVNGPNDNTNNSSTIIQFNRLPTQQTAFLGHSNIATNEFSIRTTVDNANILLRTNRNNTGSIFIQDVSGLVGVGTTAPRYNLHVNGSMFASTISTTNLFTSSLRMVADTSGIYQGVYLSSGRLMLDNRALAFTTDTNSNTGGIASIPLHLSANTLVISTISSQQIFTSTLTANGLTTLINQPILRRWVGVGEGGTGIEYSDNLTLWNNVANSYTQPINTVIYDGTRYILGANVIATSTDGTSWTNITSPPTFTTCFALATDGRTYLAGCTGTNKILRSVNGTSWSAITTSVFGTGCYGLSTNGRIWAAVGEGTNTLALSTDNGSNWTGRGTSIFSTAGRCVAYNGTLWVAGGEGTNTLAYSYDASNWTAVSGSTFVFGTACRGVAWNGSMWVAVGNGTNNIAYSFDGISWSGLGDQFGSTGTGYSITWNGSIWLAGGTGKIILTSPDGITWAQRSSSFGTSGRSYAFSSNITPDLQMSNFGIYSQGVPNYTTSTNQLLITSTTTVLNNSLFVNNATTNVGINVLPSTSIALDVNGRLRTSDQAILSSIVTNSVSSMFLNTSNLTTTIENSRVINTSSIYASTMTVSSINTSTINASTILAFRATLASTTVSSIAVNTLSSGQTRVSSLAIGTNTNTIATSDYVSESIPLYISTSESVGQVISYNNSSGNTIFNKNYMMFGENRSGSGSVSILMRSDPTSDYDFGIVRQSGTNGNTNFYHYGTGELKFSATQAAPITLVTDLSERMRITPTGTVGIGTTSPSQTLDVRGSVYASGKYIVEKGASASAPDYTFNGDTGIGLYSPTGNTVALATNSTERLRINGSGQIGIGTNNPSIFLDVNGAGRMASLSTSIISTQAIQASSISTTFLYGSTIVASNISTNLLRANNASTAQVFTSSINTNYISSQLAEISTLSTVLIYTSTIATMLMSTVRFEAGTLAFNTGSFTNLAVSGSGTISNNWSSNVIVAGGTGGTHTLAYSTNNGSNWTGAGNTIVTSVNAVVWDGTQFIAAGENNTTSVKVMTSANGIDWTNITSFIMTTIYDVAYNGRMYVMVGTGGGSIQTNTSGPSGATWTGWNTRTGLSVGYGVAWNGSVWVAVGEKDSGASTVVYSTDGATWNNGTDFFTSRGRKVAWNGIYWIAVGQGTNTVARSTDGITWTNVSPGGITSVYDVAWNGTIWVIVGSSPTPIYYSYDGITWSGTGDPIFTTEAFSVTWTGRQFVVTGSGTNTFATSPNGTTWTARGNLTGVTAGKSIGYSHLTTSDLILPNLNIYSRNTPNYLLSTNQILVQESSMTLNHALTINKDSDFVGIRNGNPQYELDVNGVINTSTMLTRNIQTISGTASAPSYTFSEDTNTGIYRPGADTLAVTTNGTQRMVITQSGNVGIGITNPRSRLEIVGTIFTSDGDTTSPAYSFSSSDSNGLYYSPTTQQELIDIGKTDAVHVAVRGQQRVEFNEAGVNSFGGYWAQDYDIVNGTSQGNISVLKPYYTNSSYQGTALYSYNYVDSTDRPFIIGRIDGGTTAKFDITNNRLRIGDGDNPSQTLDVAGNATISGSLNVGGNQTGTTLSLNASITTPWVSTTNISTASIFASTIRVQNNITALSTISLGNPLYPTFSPMAQFTGILENGAGTELQGGISMLTRMTSTGSGPLIERMRIRANGNIGIGTTNPGQLLDVNGVARINAISTPIITVSSIVGSTITGTLGTASIPSYTFVGDTNTGIYSPGADSLAVTTGGTERMRITSGGNVGIGTTNPGSILDVTSGILQTSGGIRTPTLLVSGTSPSSVNPNGLSGYLQASIIYASGSVIVNASTPSIQVGSTVLANGPPGIYSPASGNIAIVTESMERIRINSSGNIGIGLTNPTNSLTVRGNSTGTSAFTGGTRFGDTTNNGQFFIEDGTTPGRRLAMGYSSQDNIAIIQSISSGIGLCPLAINPSGNTVIGIASCNLSYTLQSGDTYLTTGGNSTDAGGALAFGVAVFPTYSPMSQIKGVLTNATGSETQGGIAFSTRPSGTAGQTMTERMRITNSGNVGIGTNAASGYKLEVVGTVGVSGVLESYATGDGVIKMANNATLQAKNAAGTYQNVFWPRASDNITYLNYGTAGFNIRNNSATTTMFMTNDGKVGIGTTTPITSSVFDIVGGSDNNGDNGSNIFAIQYRTGGFRHFIKTRHDSTAGNGNGIDFYVNNSGTAGGSTNVGTGNVLRMSIAGNGVGIGTTSPGRMLDVATGPIRVDGLDSYQCRAYCQSQTATTFLGRNIASISYDGAGQWTITMTTGLGVSNYVVVVGPAQNAVTQALFTGTLSATQFRIVTYGGSSNGQYNWSCAVFL